MHSLPMSLNFTLLTKMEDGSTHLFNQKAFETWIIGMVTLLFLQLWFFFKIVIHILFPV